MKKENFFQKHVYKIMSCDILYLGADSSMKNKNIWEEDYSKLSTADKAHRKVMDGVPLTSDVIKFYSLILVVSIFAKLLFNF